MEEKQPNLIYMMEDIGQVLYICYNKQENRMRKKELLGEPVLLVESYPKDKNPLNLIWLMPA